MHKKALLALVLVMAMLLSGCALIEKDPAVDRATEIIRVGDTVYTKGEILDETQYQLDYTAYYYSMFGMNYDPTDPAVVAETRQVVIDGMVDNAVCADKVVELGLDQLTADEQAQLDANAQETWQTNLDSIREVHFAGTELTGDELQAALIAKSEEQGVNYDYVVEYEKANITAEKLYNYVVADVQPTEEELKAEYDEKVAADQESFTSYPYSYGNMVSAANTVYYRPAGYRMVKQILVKFTEEDQAKIDELNASVSEQQSAVNAATSVLTDMGAADVNALAAQVQVTVADGAVTDVTASFDETVTEEMGEQAKLLAQAQALLNLYNEQLAQAKKAGYANIDAEADAILAQLADGADWDALMAEKTQDPGMQSGKTAEVGYAVSADSVNMDEPFVAASMAIAEVGGVSPKTEGMYGYYIIKYVSDVEEGPVPMEDVKAELTETVLAEKKDTVYAQTVAQWVEEAKPSIDYKALDN